MIVNLVLALVADLAATATSTYAVTIPQEKDFAHVEWTYAANQPYFEIDEGAHSEGVSGGLAGFVEDLTVTRGDGTDVSVEGPEAGRWRIDAQAGESITVRYKVRLEHEKHPWSFGADEVAYTRDDSIFFVSRTLLLLNPGADGSRVRLVLPEGWRAAVPWTPVEGEALTYDVPNRRLLAQSCMLIGDFIEREVRVGETVVMLAIGRGLGPYADVLESGVRACVPAYEALFRDSPQSRFLGVINVSASGGITNGSAYPNSLSILAPQRMEGVNFDQAIYTLAHEILHLWNGNRMRSPAQLEWFREGFTDYVAWRTLAQLNLVEERSLLSELRRQLVAYLNLDRRVSMTDAGARKSGNAVLIYEGGSLAALCLDSMLRRRSSGDRGIFEFMREVYARSALRNTACNAELLDSVASELAGDDMQAFFDRYITGLEALPLEDCLAGLGLRLDLRDTNGRIAATVTPDESATGVAAAARDEFLGRK